MTVRDLLKKANIEKQCEIVYQKEFSTNKRGRKLNKVKRRKMKKIRKVQTYFINMLLSLTPKKEDGIIVFEKYWDGLEDNTNTSYITPELYHKEDLEIYLKNIENKDIPTSICDESLLGEELKKLRKTFDDFPQAYAFEFEEWETILGWDVYEGNLEELGLQECIYNILYEMSFNGITRKTHDERVSDLEESIKEAEEMMALPEEERNWKTFSIDDLRKEFNIPEPTKEEQLESDRIAWACALKTAIWKFNNFKKMIGD